MNNLINYNYHKDKHKNFDLIMQTIVFCLYFSVYTNHDMTLISVAIMKLCVRKKKKKKYTKENNCKKKKKIVVGKVSGCLCAFIQTNHHNLFKT